MKILLFKHHDFLSFLIKAISRGSYVHAALLLDDQSPQIFEAFYPEVRFRDLHPSELRDFDVFGVEGLSDLTASTIKSWCQGQVAHHDKYSIADLFRFLPEFRALAGEPSAEEAAHSMFCSMAVFSAFQACGVNLLNAHPYEVAPSQLAWSPLLHNLGQGDKALSLTWPPAQTA